MFNYSSQFNPLQPPLSGSSGNFISKNLIDRIYPSCQRHARELRFETINGKPLGRGCVRFETPPLRLRIGSLHEEEIIFLVQEEATVDLILGRPWLIIHSPEIRWETSEVIRWSKFFHQHCLKGIPHPRLQSPTTQVASTWVESPELNTTPTIPSDYRAFQDVFSKQAATKLPPHRPWDCAIDLLPGHKLPKGRVYPIHCPSRSARLWRSTFRRLSIKVTSIQLASSIKFLLRG